MAKNSELTARQRRMIVAMLASRTIGEACESVGVGRTTLTRWLRDDKFTGALKGAQSEAMTNAGCQLIAAQEKSIQVLIDLAASGQSEAVKRAAANDLLAYSLKFNDQFDLEQRIDALEKAVLHDK